jgi:hypothetical protein
MSARQAMTMRTSILRDQGTADDLGAETASDWQPVAESVACRCFYASGRLQINATESNPIGQLMLLIPLGTDLQADDQIGDVTDRQGTVLFAGPLMLSGPVGHRQDHLCVTLREL